MFRSLRDQFDPLGRQILEGAFDATWSAIEGSISPVEFDRDEGLDIMIRRGLIEIARFNEVSDPESLRDVLLARLLAVPKIDL